VLVIAAPITAQRPPAEPEATEEAWHLQRLSGHWGGRRDDLEARGLSFHLLQLGDASVVASGGREPGSTAFRWLWELGAEWDLGPSLGLDGWTLAANAQLQRGEDGSREVGDLQVYSNIDGPDRTQMSALTATYAPDAGPLGLKLGKWDANDDFALVDSGVYHLQSSFGFAPTIVGFPSYPDPAFGAALFARGEGVHFGIASFDGSTQAGVPTGPRGPQTLLDSPVGWFHVAQLTLGDTPGADTPSNARLGVFHHTGSFDDGQGRIRDGATGYFASAEAPLWRTGQTRVEEAERALSGFVHYGYSDPDVSEIEHYVGAGLLWTGPIARRPRDALGAGVAWARTRDILGDETSAGSEVSVELFYRICMPRGVVLVPDLQWILNPGADGSTPDALVFTLRVEADF
jgi:porin